MPDKKKGMSEMRYRRLKGPVTGKGTKVKKGTQAKSLKSKDSKSKKKKPNRPFSAHGAVQKIRKRQMILDKI